MHLIALPLPTILLLLPAIFSVPGHSLYLRQLPHAPNTKAPRAALLDWEDTPNLKREPLAVPIPKIPTPPLNPPPLSYPADMIKEADTPPGGYLANRKTETAPLTDTLKRSGNDDYIPPKPSTFSKVEINIQNDTSYEIDTSTDPSTSNSNIAPPHPNTPSNEVSDLNKTASEFHIPASSLVAPPSQSHNPKRGLSETPLKFELEPPPPPPQNPTKDSTSYHNNNNHNTTADAKDQLSHLAHHAAEAEERSMKANLHWRAEQQARAAAAEAARIADEDARRRARQAERDTANWKAERARREAARAHTPAAIAERATAERAAAERRAADERAEFDRRVAANMVEGLGGGGGGSLPEEHGAARHVAPAAADAERRAQSESGQSAQQAQDDGLPPMNGIVHISDREAAVLPHSSSQSTPSVQEVSGTHGVQKRERRAVAEEEEKEGEGDKEATAADGKVEGEKGGGHDVAVAVDERGRLVGNDAEWERVLV